MTRPSLPPPPPLKCSVYCPQQPTRSTSLRVRSLFLLINATFLVQHRIFWNWIHRPVEWVRVSFLDDVSIPRVQRDLSCGGFLSLDSGFNTLSARFATRNQWNVSRLLGSFRTMDQDNTANPRDRGTGPFGSAVFIKFLRCPAAQSPLLIRLVFCALILSRARVFLNLALPDWPHVMCVYRLRREATRMPVSFQHVMYDQQNK